MPSGRRQGMAGRLTAGILRVYSAGITPYLQPFDLVLSPLPSATRGRVGMTMDELLIYYHQPN